MYAEAGFRVLPVKPGSKALPNGIAYGAAVDNPQRALKWWGAGGRYRGFGVSLAGGMGELAIVDLDVREGKDGPGRWLDIVGMEAASFAPRAVTPSGGIHLLFHWFPGAESISEKVSKGVDIRGGGPDSSSGHALVWPTIYNGMEYQWVEGGDVQSAPASFIEQVAKVTTLSYARKRAAVGGGRGQVVEVEEIEVVPIVDIIKILKQIDINGLTYDEWLKVGMAIKTHHQTEEGLKAWDDWSSKESDRYVEGECAKKWRGFNRPGLVTVGTLKLYAQATKAGMSATDYQALAAGEKNVTEETISDLIDEMNKNHAVIIHGNKARIIITRPNRGPLDRGYDLITREDFMTKMLSKRTAVRNAGNRVVEKSWAEVWMADPRRKDFAGMVMDPSKPREFVDRGELVFNMWCGWAVEPMPGHWGTFREHIHKVICSGDDKMFEWVLDWMAYAVQRPDRLPGTAIVLRGGEGAGKGTFAHLFGKLFGRHYRHLTQHEHLVGKFNSMLEDAVLVFADEVTYGGDRRTAGVLKGYVTEPTINVERKGLEAHTFKNNIHLIIASNEEWVVPAGPTARRWLCLGVAKDRLQDRPYFAAILRQMENQGGLEAMFHDLLHREIKNDVAVAPSTAMRDEQKAEYVTGDSVQKWWSIILGAGQIPFGLVSKINPGDEDHWPDEGRFKAQIAFNHYEEWCIKRNIRMQSEYKFYTRLYDYGVQKRKVKGMNFMQLGELEIHRQIFTAKVGFNVFAINDSEERDNED